MALVLVGCGAVSRLFYLPALRELARCYYSGIGTEKDPEAGLECLTLAAKAGDEESNILLDMQNISTSEQAEINSGF